MSFTSYYRLVSYLTVAVAFLTLALTDAIGFGSIAFFGGGLTIGWLTDAEKLDWRVPPVIVKSASFAALPLFLIDWQVVGGTLTGSLARLIVLLTVLKLISAKQDRDWLFLICLSLFEVLLAATLSISISFFVSLMAYILALLLTLTAAEIHRSQSSVETVGKAELLEAPRRRRRASLALHLIRVSFVLLGLSLCLAAPLFIFMPRASGSWLGQGLGIGQTLTGFTDSVTLGEIANIKKNPQIVMRVQIPGVDPATIAGTKWRGIALDRYDGHIWQNTLSRRDVIPRSQRYMLDDNLRQVRGENLTKQTFFLEPLYTPILFTPRRPLVLEGSMRRVMLDASQSVFTEEHGTTRLAYSIYSDHRKSSPSALEQANGGIPEGIRERYLNLPPTFDPRIRRLATQITRSAKTNYERATLLEEYLRTNYGYTLDLKRTDESDPLVDFLFNTKQGHCEYFATAMAVMLRSLGIASRVVNGFQTGEYNAMSGVWVVRQSDAHSWVEAYFPIDAMESARWVEFDPTPAAGQSSAQSDMLAGLRRFADALEFFWQQHVVSYDAQQQLTIWQQIEWTVSDWKNWLVGIYQAFITSISPKDKSSSNKYLLFLVISSILAAVLLPVIAVIGRRKLSPDLLRRIYTWLWRLRRSSTYRESAFESFNRMQRLLARHGLVRPAGQTPLEFARDTGFAEVLRITTYYNRVRFGGLEIKAEGLSEMDVALAELQGRLKQKGS